MKIWIWTCLVALTIATCAAPPESAEASRASINAVTGDTSWRELRGTAVADATESERISVHLDWVGQTLRKSDVSHLDPQAQVRRFQLLDALDDYRLRGEFPRHTQSTGDGRTPRWVDDRGVHCAVAHLVSASGRSDLVAAIQREHEYAYIPDIEVTALSRWAGDHGFEERELAMIQPTYDDGGSVHVPSKHEEARARKRAEAEAKIPRPLGPEVLDLALQRYVSREHNRACFGKRTGTWRLSAKLAVGGDVVPVARVDVVDTLTGQRDAKLSKCWAGKLRLLARNVLADKNYTVKGKVEASKVRTITVPTRRQVIESFLGLDVYEKQRQVSRAKALAKCLETWPEDELPLQLPITVASWNGYITIDGAALGVTHEQALSRPRDVRARWHCVGDIIRYGSIEPRPLYDTTFWIELGSDGGMVLAQQPAPK